MSNLPLHSLYLSDFRRLGGDHVVPLDAPVVLIHGPNGTGKTSILAGLEMALTGDVRSMRRQDDRYISHLPHHGQPYATLRATVSQSISTHEESQTMTVGGSRIDGAPALKPELAQFYAERCYLDQVSLGQLLDLYQYREGKAESALARFVNELLGLEQLDALQTGLSGATDYRRLKRLSDALVAAESERNGAEFLLQQSTTQLEVARANLNAAREELGLALSKLGFEAPVSDARVEEVARQWLQSLSPERELQSALDVDKLVAALGGRIRGLARRPETTWLDERRNALQAALSSYDKWRSLDGPAIDAWTEDAARIGVSVGAPEEAKDAIEARLLLVDRLLDRQIELETSRDQLELRIASLRTALIDITDQLAEAEERAGALVEALATIRDLVRANACPVCDRDFSDISSEHLTTHIDRKIGELTAHSAKLRELRERQVALSTELTRDERLFDQLSGRLMSDAEREELVARREGVIALISRLAVLQPKIDRGLQLHRNVIDLQIAVDEMIARVSEEQEVRSELAGLADRLEAFLPLPDETAQEAWQRLDSVATDYVKRAKARQDAHEHAMECLKRTREAQQSVRRLTSEVGRSAENKIKWDRRIQEAKRRQRVARQVLDASAKARAEIVQRVFTQSLNDVWRNVFTRLAPAEPFVPAFGIPSASHNSLELSLGTVHKSGRSGGPPQMMLSAGNLNTAALSLFVALHLAVEPLMPCLVFDDPVQAMDEVHVAQFAGLIRVLSKQHGRQVVIAVHERELFEYLSLELSPAFDGDELITVELGVSEREIRTERLVWRPDAAIAV